MKLPSLIKIGTQKFVIEERLPGDDGMLSDSCFGYTLEARSLIVIDQTLSDGKKQVVLIHELMHAMNIVFAGVSKPSKKDDYDAWEHHFIGVWEHAFLLMLRDNPELVKYLMEE